MEHVEGMGEPTAGESSCPRVTSSHNLVIQKADSMLAMMLEDPFLSDLCEDCSLENVQSRLALLQGRAISIYVNKFDGQVISLIVLQGVTVSELMQALQRKVEKQCTKEGRTKHISWQYVWNTYCLVHGQTLLEDSQAKLVSYGIGNQASLHFTKKLKKQL